MINSEWKSNRVTMKRADCQLRVPEVSPNVSPGPIRIKYVFVIIR